jgi:hypothetical protein
MTLLHRITEQQQRIRRQAIEFNVGTNKKVIKPYMKVEGNNNYLALGSDGSDSDMESDGLKTANTILKDGSDLIGAPSRFLNSMQQNWLLYLVLMAVILVCILILYFIIKSQCSSVGKFFGRISCIKKSVAHPEPSSSKLIPTKQPRLQSAV